MFSSSEKEIKAWFRNNGKFIFAEKPFWGIKFEKQKIYIYSESKAKFIKSPLKEPFEALRSFILKDSEILIGFLSYDFAGEFEPLVKDDRENLIDFPDICFFAFKQFFILDELPFQKEPLIADSCTSLIEDKYYLQMIKAALEEIKAGNIYEINLSRPFVFNFTQKPNSETISANLWEKNPAPFSGYLKIDSERAICSASPECFLHKDGHNLSTFPIKGTRPRLQDKTKDQAQIEELLNSPKERAEHLMVVDLERNDLGKIAVAGSVKVKDFLKVQSFEYIHHLVSEINCKVKDNLNIFDILAQTFPSGSITGAPKIKTMQTIKNLEPCPRSAYTGCFGFIDSKGNADFSILIRTLLLSHSKAYLQVGGGIVLDSEPEFELEETYIKARGFFDLFEGLI